VLRAVLVAHALHLVVDRCGDDLPADHLVRLLRRGGPRLDVGGLDHGEAALLHLHDRIVVLLANIDAGLLAVVVGDGQQLAPIDYMVWKDQVNVLDQPRIFKLLSRGPRLEGYLTQLRRADKLDFASWGGFAQNFSERRIPFEHAHINIHSLSAAAIESVKLKPGQNRPIAIQIKMNNSAGLFQLDELLKQKINSSTLKGQIELTAVIEAEAEKKLIEAYKLYQRITNLR